MPSTFDENKESCKKYLQEMIEYNYKGGAGAIVDALEVLKEECRGYMTNFEERCQTVEKLRDFRRTVENVWDQFCEVVGKPAKGSWEETMLSSMKSKINVCIHNLNEMGGKPINAEMILYRLRNI